MTAEPSTNAMLPDWELVNSVPSSTASGSPPGSPNSVAAASAEDPPKVCLPEPACSTPVVTAPKQPDDGLVDVDLSDCNEVDATGNAQQHATDPDEIKFSSEGFIDRIVDSDDEMDTYLPYDADVPEFGSGKCAEVLGTSGKMGVQEACEWQFQSPPPDDCQSPQSTNTEWGMTYGNDIVNMVSGWFRDLASSSIKYMPWLAAVQPYARLLSALLGCAVAGLGASCWTARVYRAKLAAKDQEIGRLLLQLLQVRALFADRHRVIVTQRSASGARLARPRQWEALMY
eukprot:jgi/Mesvir1/23144/Mv10532-RA.1